MRPGGRYFLARNIAARQSTGEMTAGLPRVVVRRGFSKVSKDEGSGSNVVDAFKSFGIGTLAGTLGGVAGMGGGFVMIPLMTSRLLRLSQHQAHGTSLFAVTTTGIAGALGYGGQVDLEAAAAIASCGVISARFGARATASLSEKSLRKALGFFMLMVAPIVPAKTYLARGSESHGGEETPISARQQKYQRLTASATIGIASGFLAGLFGVGGGAVVVPALTLATDMNHYEALGTSLCAMILPAMVGTFTHYGKGNVSLRVAPALAAGAFLGGFLGGKIGLGTDEATLRWGFGGLMGILGLRTILVR